MFPWNIAKSAEAMASRYFIKKICKFLLKKKLGQFIIGEIDNDQLDIQLSAGTIQLSDLALNVDLLNHELQDVAPLRVKAGSIRSLCVKLPWFGEGCIIEIDELELELGLAVGPAYCANNAGVSKGTEPCNLGESGVVSADVGQHNHPWCNESMASTSPGVHEGVKVVANAVKSLLTSFHVKVKNVIIAFDPRTENYGEKARSQKTLVLRIADIECGTRISGDSSLGGDAKVGNFLQINRLANFLKFQGVSLELLKMGEDLNDELEPFAPLSDCCSTATTNILSGDRNGISGTLTLSLPWKNGSLEIRKVDADCHINPVKVKLEPSVMEWLLLLWGTLESYKNNLPSNHDQNKNSILVDSSMMCSSYSSIPCSPSRPNDKVLPSWGSLSTDIGLLLREDVLPDTLLQDSHLISDWVPESKKDRIEERDLGASLDQFFECFDGMRSSQSLLGSSGMWNSICSVFSVITAASNIASGSSHFPAEQQHIETNLKITFAEVSLITLFIDENQKECQDFTGIGSSEHYFASRWKDIIIVLQVCPKDWRLEATVNNIILDDCFDIKEDAVISGSESGMDNVSSLSCLIQTLQKEVQNVLPSFSAYSKVFDLRVKKASGLPSARRCKEMKKIRRKNLVKASLLKTFGPTSFLLHRSSKSSDGCFTGPTSFSLQLPPLLLWVNLHSLKELLELLVRIHRSSGIHSSDNFPSENLKEKQKKIINIDANQRAHPDSIGSSSKGSLHGNIFIPTARVTLCYPTNSCEGFGSYLSSNQFTTLDFSSVQKSEGQDISLMEESMPTSVSLHFIISAVDVYLITRNSKDVDSQSSAYSQKQFFSHKVLSLKEVAGHPSVVSVLYPENAVSGAWIKNKAKCLATSDDLSSKHRRVERGYEFTSIAKRKVAEDLHTQTRKEMISSSNFLLHARLSSVMVALGSKHYASLCFLLNHVLDMFCGLARNSDHVIKENGEDQKSILLDCNSLEVSLELDVMDSTKKSSLQRELPGSWNNLKLNVHSLQLLSGSDVGGTRGSDFFWLSHEGGKLAGSVSGVPGEEFLLLLASNSSKGRGNGEGSNVLFCRDAGSDIVYFWDPEDSHSFMSVTLRCVTLVAPGGRLDWMDDICNFFKLPSPENSPDNRTRSEGRSKGVQDCAAPESSFTFSLVDGGLSYEPVLQKSVSCHLGSSFKCDFTDTDKGTCEPVVACLLAASSLRLSSQRGASASDVQYNIKILDVGLLLHPVSKFHNSYGDYGFEYLHKTGYCKVASVAVFLAVLRTNMENGSWELASSESHIALSTCHDTANGLKTLASQIQQLFAPDVEEWLVHLQNRWEQTQGRIIPAEDTESDGHSLASNVKQTGSDSPREVQALGLIDMIYEDAFSFGVNREESLGHHGPNVSINALPDRQGISCLSESSKSLSGVSDSSAPVAGLEGHLSSILQNTEIMEGYYLSELGPLSKPTEAKQRSEEFRESNLSDGASQDARRGSSGWYGNTSLEILENHVSHITDLTTSTCVEGTNMSSGNLECDNSERFKGRVLLSNLNVQWEMLSGIDWHEGEAQGDHSGSADGRNNNVCLELELCDTNIQYTTYPDGAVSASKLRLSVKDCYLYDKSRNAPWKLVLGYYHSKEFPRQSSSKALKIDLEAVRPDPSTPLEEYRLHVAVCPLLLHLHQSHLDFLVAFFGERRTSFDDSVATSMSSDINDPESSTMKEEALLPFFQKFNIWPTVVRIDYRPSRVDLAALSSGKYIELVNMLPWKGVELQLKHVQAIGVYGLKNVFETVIGDWLEEISQNQMHKLLQGIPTIQSLVTVGSGAAKLVSMPVKSYCKDHRLLKSLQRGSLAFLRSLSVEAIGLGVHIAGGAHDILLHAESMLSMQPSLQRHVESEMRSGVRYDQPKDAQQGFQQACDSITDGLGRAASALIHSPLRSYQRDNSASSAFVNAMKGAPAAAVAPASGAAQAAYRTLLGVRNTLDPDHKEESIKKYSGSSNRRDS